MRGRLVLASLLAIVGLASCAAFAACSNSYSAAVFPSDAAAVDVAMDALGDASDLGDADDAGAPGMSDASSTDGGTFDAGDPCDKDGDGYRAIECDGGNDCDDEDSRAHPGAAFLIFAPSAKTGGDWDCDGIVTKQYADDLSCIGLPNPGCATASGFTTDPGCGEIALFDYCGPGLEGLNCGVKTSDMTAQGCR